MNNDVREIGPANKEDMTYLVSATLPKLNLDSRPRFRQVVKREQHDPSQRHCAEAEEVKEKMSAFRGSFGFEGE